tara:strand:+ start:2401 stop:2748 length:348 start_codon:yes stop_codon:yes gene_type:complete
MDETEPTLQGTRETGTTTNARSVAGALALYEKENEHLLKAIDGLQALKVARATQMAVNPANFLPIWSGGLYDPTVIEDMIDSALDQQTLTEARIVNLRKTLDSYLDEIVEASRNG